MYSALRDNSHTLQEELQITSPSLLGVISTLRLHGRGERSLVSAVNLEVITLQNSVENECLKIISFFPEVKAPSSF